MHCTNGQTFDIHRTVKVYPQTLPPLPLLHYFQGNPLTPSSQFIHIKPRSRYLLSSWLQLLQQSFLPKCYLGPYHCWYYHQTPRCVYHQIKAPTTPTHQGLDPVIPPTLLQDFYLLDWWRWRSFQISRLYANLYWPWRYCWYHWWLFLFNQQKCRTSPSNHK